MTVRSSRYGPVLPLLATLMEDDRPSPRHHRLPPGPLHSVPWCRPCFCSCSPTAYSQGSGSNTSNVLMNPFPSPLPPPLSPSLRRHVVYSKGCLWPRSSYVTWPLVTFRFHFLPLFLFFAHSAQPPWLLCCSFHARPTSASGPLRLFISLLGNPFL